MSFFGTISTIVINKKLLGKEFNLNEGNIKNLELFYNLIMKYQSIINYKSASFIIQNLIEDINLKKEYNEKQKDTKILNSFIEKIKEWEKEYMINNNNNIFSISNLLERIKIFIDINDSHNDYSNEEDENTKILNCVKLMTIHSAKGLEFTNIFIVGTEEGYFPSFIDCNDIFEDDLEEERRIFYVALTRAKQNCFISYCKRRKFKDKFINRTVSRFVTDIPEELTEIYNEVDYLYIPVSRRIEKEEEKLKLLNGENKIINNLSYENYYLNQNDENKVKLINNEEINRNDYKSIKDEILKIIELEEESDKLPDKNKINQKNHNSKNEKNEEKIIGKKRLLKG